MYKFIEKVNDQIAIYEFGEKESISRQEILMDNSFKKLKEYLKKNKIVLSSVESGYNNSKTDFSPFYRLLFKVSGFKGRANKDELSSGKYLVTLDFDGYKKGKFKHEPNFIDMTHLNITKIGGSKGAYLDDDLHPAFLVELVSAIFLYSIICKPKDH